MATNTLPATVPATEPDNAKPADAKQSPASKPVVETYVEICHFPPHWYFRAFDNQI